MGEYNKEFLKKKTTKVNFKGLLYRKKTIQIQFLKMSE